MNMNASDVTIEMFEDEIEKQKVIEEGARERIEFLEKSIKEIIEKEETVIQFIVEEN